METKKNESALEAATERETAAAGGETWKDLEGAVEQAAEDDTELVVKFRRPYTFEGQEYTEVDLSGLENVTAGKLEEVGRVLLKKRPGLNPSTLEMTMDYANLLATCVTGKPMEFFERLPGREGMRIKTTVVGFLYGGDGDN